MAKSLALKISSSAPASATTYIEPFVGGGSVTAAVAAQGRFREMQASDLHQDLILMWQAVQASWQPPTDVSEDDYEALRNAEPSALRGFVGYGCSFSGKWFGGYARDGRYPGRSYAGESSRSLQRAAKHLTDVSFACRDYAESDVTPGCVVYADPPYVNTTKYDSASTGFDYARFWSVVDAWDSSGAYVFVSERSAPDGWIPVLTVERNRNVAGSTGRLVDSLWVHERHASQIAEGSTAGKAAPA